MTEEYEKAARTLIEDKKRIRRLADLREGKIGARPGRSWEKPKGDVEVLESAEKGAPRDGLKRHLLETVPSFLESDQEVLVRAGRADALDAVLVRDAEGMKGRFSPWTSIMTRNYALSAPGTVYFEIIEDWARHATGSLLFLAVLSGNFDCARVLVRRRAAPRDMSDAAHLALFMARETEKDPSFGVEAARALGLPRIDVGVLSAARDWLWEASEDRIEELFDPSDYPGSRDRIVARLEAGVFVPGYALARAAEEGDAEMVGLLLDAGGSVDDMCEVGSLRREVHPLVAARTDRLNAETAAQWLRRGWNPDGVLSEAEPRLRELISHARGLVLAERERAEMEALCPETKVRPPRVL